MKRILLLIEEFNELVFIETFLRKIGFDVLGIQKASKLDGSILSFNPAIIILSGKSKQIPVHKIAIGIKEKKSSNSLKIVVLMSGKPQKLSEDEGQIFDGALNSPIEPLKVIQLISDLSGVDQQKLTEKYDKMVVARESQIAKEQSDKDLSIIRGGDDGNPVVGVSGSRETQRSEDSPLKGVKPREDHYKKFLAEQPKVDTKKTLPSEVMRKAAQELAKADKSGDPTDEDRRSATESFLRALFKRD